MDAEKDFRTKVFNYIRGEGSEGRADEIRKAVKDFFPDLVACDVKEAVGLVRSLFAEHHEEIISALKAEGVSEKLLFDYLNCVYCEGGTGGGGMNAAIQRTLDIDDRHLFIKLMSRFDAGKVRDFLKERRADICTGIFEGRRRGRGRGRRQGADGVEDEKGQKRQEPGPGNAPKPETAKDTEVEENYEGDIFYKVEEALRICTLNNIADASAYLLELKGEVGKALELMLCGLENNLVEIKAKIRMSGGNIEEMVGG